LGTSICPYRAGVTGGASIHKTTRIDRERGKVTEERNLQHLRAHDENPLTLALALTRAHVGAPSRVGIKRKIYMQYFLLITDYGSTPQTDLCIVPAAPSARTRHHCHAITRRSDTAPLISRSIRSMPHSRQKKKEKISSIMTSGDLQISVSRRHYFPAFTPRISAPPDKTRGKTRPPSPPVTPSHPGSSNVPI
jgi:hypothetical protein